MRVLFYGTPEFALPTLEALLRHHQVVAVVTQPDRPAHRGQHLTAPPVKRRAAAAGLPVFQPERLREPGWAERLAAFTPEVGVVVAYGQILPRPILEVPARGSINVHASLLPRYRGAAPIAWAIIRGEAVTGVTTFLMDEGMDTGPILLQSAPVAIGPEETAGELAARLAPLGAELLLQTLERLDHLVPSPQEGEPTYAPRLTRAHGLLDWSRPAVDLANLIRGCNPWPGAHTQTPRGRLTLWRARALPGEPRGTPGTLCPRDGTLVIATADGALLPLEVQPENRRSMSWEEYLRGARWPAGTRFHRPDAPR